MTSVDRGSLLYAFPDQGVLDHGWVEFRCIDPQRHTIGPLECEPPLAGQADSVGASLDFNVMDDESLFGMNLNGRTVSAETRNPGQSLFGCGCDFRFPFGPTGIHGDVAHVTGIGVDDVTDADWMLPRRSVSQTLCSRHQTPHAHELLGHRIFGLSMRSGIEDGTQGENRHRSSFDGSHIPPCPVVWRIRLTDIRLQNAGADPAKLVSLSAGRQAQSKHGNRWTGPMLARTRTSPGILQDPQRIAHRRRERVTTDALRDP